MTHHGRNGHEDIVDEAVQSINECPVPDQIKGLDWSLLLQKLDRDTDRDTSGAVPSSSTKIWRTIMNKRLIKYGVAAVLVIGVTILLWPIVENGGSSVAFAEVVRQINEARTLTFSLTAQTRGADPTTTQYMYMEPGRWRVRSQCNIFPAPLPEGSIHITDLTKGEILVLDPAKRTATKLDVEIAAEKVPDIIQEMKNLPVRPDKKLGVKDIDGKNAEGFVVHKHDHVFIVWVDQQTGLPLRIEGETASRQGQKVKLIASNINFNAELDEALFSLKAPPGFVLKPVSDELERSRRMALRTQSAVNIHKLAAACIRYSQDNRGKWPDSLQELGRYGVVAKDRVNPLQPEMKAGYSYFKPVDTPVDPGRLLIHEKHKVWEDGVNVAFANGRVQFITDETEFKSLVKKLGAK